MLCVLSLEGSRLRLFLEALIFVLLGTFTYNIHLYSHSFIHLYSLYLVYK